MVAFATLALLQGMWQIGLDVCTGYTVCSVWQCMCAGCWDAASVAGFVGLCLALCLIVMCSDHKHVCQSHAAIVLRDLTVLKGQILYRLARLFLESCWVYSCSDMQRPLGMSAIRL